MKQALFLAAFLALAACGQEPASDAGSSAAGATRSAEAPQTPEARGRRQFNECAVCHTVKEGEANRIGPNLYGVIGREAGLVDGFAYSQALRNSGVVWTDEALDAFMENPQGFMRGNRMAYAGQRDAQKRADIIAYLKSLDSAAD